MIWDKHYKKHSFTQKQLSARPRPILSKHLPSGLQTPFASLPFRSWLPSFRLSATLLSVVGYPLLRSEPPKNTSDSRKVGHFPL